MTRTSEPLERTATTPRSRRSITRGVEIAGSPGGSSPPWGGLVTRVALAVSTSALIVAARRRGRVTAMKSSLTSDGHAVLCADGAALAGPAGWTRTAGGAGRGGV
ncbi:hypothetical protein, partial [Actinoalloteichus caeruleus]|uniref:hypothetical protein n=1 Tax=Actinoalloteichus cyanogriseus TaxID=2893586 RepID=UPI00200F656C